MFLVAALTLVLAAFASLESKPPRIQSNTNRAPAGSLRNGVLTIHLEVRSGMWFPEAEDGASTVVQAFAEAGRPLQIPGPLIRVREGTIIEATIRNPLVDSALILYGFHTRPGSLEDTLQIAPGTTRKVRFKAGSPGTYYYWGTTTNRSIEDREWIDSQLSGALIVDPIVSAGLEDDRVLVMGIWFQPADSSGPDPHPERELLVINGKSWPHTERFTYTQGDSVRWRWINATGSTHPMHLHGFYYRVDSRGTWAADTVYRSADQRLVNTELMPISGTMDMRWSPERAGNWVFHCHFAFHVGAEQALTPIAPAMDGHSPGAHAPHPMAGLVPGLHVLPRSKSIPTAITRGARRIRLLIQTSSAPRYGKHHATGFVVQDGKVEPPTDSVAIPGPTLLLRRGEPVRITVVNRLKEVSAVHWHGIELESFPDGVPGWSGLPGRIFPPIAPSDSFVAEFTPPRAGTFMYHSHSNEGHQISSGMYGALIVTDPERQPFDSLIDRLVIVGAAGPFESPVNGLIATVNGSENPAPIDLRVGVKYRFRLININPEWRVNFSLVSDTAFAQWRAVAKDGADLPASQATFRTAHLQTGPGETADFEFTPKSRENLRLEVKTPRTGWHIPVLVRVR